METIDLVELWKQPGAREGETLDHPAGEIRLRTGGRLGRRSGLLGGDANPRCSSWETLSVAPSEEHQ